MASAEVEQRTSSSYDEKFDVEKGGEGEFLPLINLSLSVLMSRLSPRTPRRRVR